MTEAGVQALVVNPNFVGVLDDLAFLSLKEGNQPKAIFYLDRALAIAPDDVTSLTNKGLALAYEQNYSQAISFYDKALAIAPDDVKALNDLGNAFYYQGSYDQALAFYNKALAIAPYATVTSEILSCKKNHVLGGWGSRSSHRHEKKFEEYILYPNY